MCFSVERLDSHTNADDHTVYRSEKEINEIKENGDPIINFIMHIYSENREAAIKRFTDMCNETRTKLREDIQKAQRAREPQAVFGAKAELPDIIYKHAEDTYQPGHNTMIAAMREVLDEWLTKDERVFLYGQDIEDPKGDVFGLTRGLSTKFAGRVENSPLSESLIIGTCIGRALAGGKTSCVFTICRFLSSSV